MSMCFTPRKQWEGYWRCYVKQEFHFYQKVMVMTRGDWFPFFFQIAVLSQVPLLFQIVFVSDCICLGGQRSNGQISILGSFGAWLSCHFSFLFLLGLRRFCGSLFCQHFLFFPFMIDAGLRLLYFLFFPKFVSVLGFSLYCVTYSQFDLLLTLPVGLLILRPKSRINQ